MRIELLTIGNELLLGQVPDTNAVEVSRALAAAGVRVVHRSTVGDDADAIAEEVVDALRRTGAVLTTGGLGPTRDDMTKTAVAARLGLPLRFDEEAWEQVQARYRHFGRVPAESNRSQAEVPAGATVLPNRWGTAPGLWLEVPPLAGGGLVIMLPGVPLEMRMLLEHEVLPRLRRLAGDVVVRSRTLRTTGVPESTLAEAVGPIEESIAPLTLAYLPGADGVDLRVTAWNLPAHDATARLAAAMADLRKRVASAVYGEDEADLAASVLEMAREKGIRLAVAESCTGGLLGARLTAVPGASDVFVGGVVAYANQVKETALGVPPALLETEGAVSEAVARAMAEGARRNFGAGLAVSITGIAGPAGGTADKPVGTVWFATSAAGGTETSRMMFGGSRVEIRARAAQAGLRLLRQRLENREAAGGSRGAVILQ